MKLRFIERQVDDEIQMNNFLTHDPVVPVYTKITTTIKVLQYGTLENRITMETSNSIHGESYWEWTDVPLETESTEEVL